MTVSWNRWTSVQEGATTPGGHVTAVPIANEPGCFRLFIADRDGIVRTNISDGKDGFEGWAHHLPINRTTAPGAPVAAVAIPNDHGRFAVFMAVVDAARGGEVVTTRGSTGQSFASWTSVQEGTTTPGGQVTAVLISNERGHVRLFVADPGGTVLTNRSDGRAGLDGWSLICGRRTRPGAPVTARELAKEPGRFALFMADDENNGEVRTIRDSARDGFANWESVQEGSTTPGAPVTAVAMPNEPGHFALFLADKGGAVFTNRSDGRAGLNGEGWQPVDLDHRTIPGASVAAVAVSNESGHFRLFMVDQAGSVLTNLSDGHGALEDWSRVDDHTQPPSVRLTPGAPVAAVEIPKRPGHFALFVSDEKGEVFATTSR